MRVHANKFESHGGVGTAFDPKANMAVGTAILVKYLAQQKTVAGALKFYVGAGYRKGDGGYARRVFLAESRLLTAVESRRRRPANWCSERRKGRPSDCSPVSRATGATSWRWCGGRRYRSQMVINSFSGLIRV